ncbi:MAG: GNAT family N-acetyltransferase [Clostridia bacterium]|nr:GNAT family N-acetyltransferase [Clostridia bacterium]
MVKIKMDKKTLKKMALMAGEAFSDDPVHSYATKIPFLRKRYIYHLMMERFSASNGKDIIYLDKENKGMCIWRDAKNDYTALEFLKCPHWIFLVIYWLPSLRTLFTYAKRDLSVFPDNTLLIEPVFVGREYQGKGIASSLIKQGINDLVPLGYNLGLETQNPDNISLYEKLGFKLISKQTLKKNRIYNFSMIYTGEKTE